jgi:hypothetical protein
MPTPALTAAPKAQPMPVVRFLRRGLKTLASLKLTVVLFVFSLLLVFFGTLAQVDNGIWTVVDQYFWSVLVWVPFDLSLKFGQIFFGLPQSWTLPKWFAFPLPGGYTLGWLLFLNLLSAHVVRFKLSWKRSGIILLHAGLVLMLASEFITREFAVEGNMTIANGESTNVVLDIRKSELAVIDGSSKDADQVTVVPQSKLRQGATITSDMLPFNVEVEEFYKNSALSQAAPGNNPATVGDGREFRAELKSEISGTDQEQKADYPSAYVKLTGKSGEDLGTYLVSVWLSDLEDRPPQTIKVGDKTYQLALRFKRTYEPFTIHLNKFTHEVYPGTNKPKNFQSDIRLVDPESGVDREVTIKMNQPMRHQGQAFYQSSFLQGDRGTVLQVVRNPGWRLPYFSCALVALGMLVHFGITLNGFLERRAA